MPKLAWPKKYTCTCSVHKKIIIIIVFIIIFFLLLLVYNWTTDDVIEWLEGVVDLPELAHQFRQLGISGRQLPL